MLSNIRIGLLGLFFYFYLEMSDKNLSGRKNVMEPSYFDGVTNPLHILLVRH